MSAINHKQHGFALAYAIFILVILAGLGGFLANVAISQQSASALEVMRAQAYQAARSGSEWGIYNALQKPTQCSATTNIGTDMGMTITVRCELAIAAGTESGMGPVYRITSTACNAPSAGSCPGNVNSANYVERRVSALTEADP